MSFGMILLIGYLTISFLVAISFYTACVMAARVEKAEQLRRNRLLGKRPFVVDAPRTGNPTPTQRLQPHLV
jgi:hypothetical protein